MATETRNCFNCGKAKAEHHSETLQCPKGRKSKAGYAGYSHLSFAEEPSNEPKPMETKEERIAAFKKRIEEDRAFCEELFRFATLKLLASKYAYYVETKPYQDDTAYDLEEKDWHIMGMALGLLTEHETSPCIDFDPTHPMANEAIARAKKLMHKR